MNARVIGRPLALVFLLVASPAFADFRLERRLPLAPGGAFTLETAAGAVTVIGDSTSDVVVTVTSPREDLEHHMGFRFDAQAGGVRVRATRRSHMVGDWLRRWGWSDRIHFDVHVPRRTGVAVQTAGGAIDVTGLEGGARVRTFGGPLRVGQIAGDVEARTNGGWIQVQDVRGNVTAHTFGGGIQVDRAGGRVEAKTSGGPITVRFAAGNGHGGTLSTAGGGVYAAIDPAATVSIDAWSAGGRVWSDLAVVSRGATGRHALRGDLNGGGPTLQLRSTGGPVHISGLER